MGLRLFNTLSRSVQEFVPLDPAGRKVGLYCCGPTVYDFAHIGNWRTFIFGDLVRRYLEFKNYAVQHVMNITDIDDKIIKRVHEGKTSLRDFTGKFEAAFFDDLKTLSCRMPHQTPRATEHIKDIVELIEKPLVPLEVAARDSDRKMKVKTIKHTDCIEVGHDKFDEVVTNFLTKVGEPNVVSITTLTYTHLDIGTQKLMTDFGVMIVYKG